MAKRKINQEVITAEFKPQILPKSCAEDKINSDLDKGSFDPSLQGDDNLNQKQTTSNDEPKPVSTQLKVKRKQPSRMFEYTWNGQIFD